MEIQLDRSISRPLRATRRGLTRDEWSVVTYWVVATILGLIFLQDLIFSWNVQSTLSRPWLVGLLVVTWMISNALYNVVAHNNGRPIHWLSAAIFTIGNGICETFAFVVVYRLGAFIGSSLAMLVFPAAASWAELGGGLLSFMIYGGLIHGLFWLRVLPPHLNDSHLARSIRRHRPIAEVALVTSWALCLWLGNDIWTVVFFHMLIDLGLMLMVRPPLFTGNPRTIS